MGAWTEYPDVIFAIFNPALLGILSFLIAFAYLSRAFWPRFWPKGMPKRMRWLFITRAINWAMFALAWFAFSLHPLVVSRALLRLTFGFLILSEGAYQIAYFGDYTISRIRKNLKWKLRQS